MYSNATIQRVKLQDVMMYLSNCFIFTGEFGIVYKAHLLKAPKMAMKSNVDPKLVAVKTLKGKLKHTLIDLIVL